MSEVKTIPFASGFVNVHKPAGITSHDVIFKLRKWTCIKRIGHAGTLDPDATGVLPIAIGSACRLISYLPKDQKVYLAEILLGTKTTTDDISGLVLERNNIDPCINRVKIESTLKLFTGVIEQLPPFYSAVKYKGQRLYHLARAKDLAAHSSDIDKIDGKLTGLRASIKQRLVNIEKIDLVEEQLPLITLRIVCSSGTYIRSLARDLGEALGCGGCLKSLSREKSNSFNIEQSISLDILEQKIKLGALSEVLIGSEIVLKLKKIELDRKASALLSHGGFLNIDAPYAQESSINNSTENEDKNGQILDERFLAIHKHEVNGQYITTPVALVTIAKNGQIRPDIVLTQPEEWQS